MLDRIVKLNDAINNVLQAKANVKHAEKKLSEDELTKITELCCVLEPFFLITEKLSSQKFATLSLIIPSIHSLYEAVIISFINSFTF